jgi:hypothetical protein
MIISELPLVRQSKNMSLGELLGSDPTSSSRRHRHRNRIVNSITHFCFLLTYLHCVFNDDSKLSESKSLARCLS